MRESDRNGFTLVELLVVITIIAILIALLLPAVNAARESARCTQCCNNLRQLASGVMQHVEKYEQYPTGGWGWGWLGDADRGHKMEQPGGWVYNVLPFIDQPALYMMSADGDADTVTSQQRAAAKEMATMPLRIMNCPTRRKSVTYRYQHHQKTTNFDVPDQIARSDYACNAGDRLTHPGVSGMQIWSSNCYNGDCGPSQLPSMADLRTKAKKASGFGGTGLVYPMSIIRPAHVTDGDMTTIMLGEKYIIPTQQYAEGGSWGSNGDNESMYIGHNQDIDRWTDRPLARDRLGYGADFSFGSSHTRGCHMAFCDGHVKVIQFEVNPAIFRLLGSRADGKNPDLTKF